MYTHHCTLTTAHSSRTLIHRTLVMQQSVADVSLTYELLAPSSPRPCAGPDLGCLWRNIPVNLVEMDIALEVLPVRYKEMKRIGYASSDRCRLLQHCRH